ncbi:MAG TPA: hypothetical protein VMS17_19415 [Gemmataceae bacterium]|nr:hypothetical protein [Gemmataceae bacterium]
MSESSADEPPGQGKYTDPAGRDVPAEDSPVPAGPATLPMGMMGVRPIPAPDCLVLRSTLGRAPLIGIVIGAGFGTLMLAVYFLLMILLMRGRAAVVLLLALALVLLSVGWMAWHWYRRTILPRVTFDKEAGLLTLGWRGRRGRRPLSSVIGVQVMQTRKQFGGPELNIPAMTMYQMNLILDDPVERRLNVMTCAAVTARSTARLVADFLGVPVLDSAGAPEGAPAAAAVLETDGSVRPELLGAPAAADVPLPTDWSSAIASPVVAEAGPDVLVIRARRLAVLFGAHGKAVWGMVLTGMVFALIAAADWNSVMLAASAVVLGCFAVVNLVMMFRILSRRACFDRERGVLTLRRVGRRGSRETWPLASVKAVEAVKVGYAEYYLLNLLLDDPQQPRLNLSMEADAALVRQAAARVASFLAVPLLGVKAPTAAAAAPGAGKEAVNPLELLSRSPLPRGRASIRGPARVVPKGDAVLVLRPRLLFHWIHWIHVVPALLGIGVVLGLGVVGLRRFGPPQAILGQLAALLAIALFVVLLPLVAALRPLLLYRDHFDRKAGLLTLGGFGLKGKYPLDKILAVQLIPGGLVNRTPGVFGGGREHVSYQMNLVMAEAYQDRLHLSDDSDLKWTRQAGRQIADFLDVPLLDQIADGD